MSRFAAIFFSIALHAGMLFSQPDFSADTLSGCDTLEVDFSLDTSTVDTDTITSYFWDFGNGKTSTLQSPETVQYIAPDSSLIFDVSLILNNDSVNAITKNSFITVHKAYNPKIYVQELNDLNVSFAPVHQLWTNDTANYTFTYTLPGGITQSPDNGQFTYTFQNAGTFDVAHQVTDRFGCTASYDTTITLTNNYAFPNILNTSVNEYILKEYNNNTPVTFQVFSRTGIKVYESQAPTIYWDGRNLSGQFLNTGVYFYLIESKSAPEAFLHQGFIYILSE